MSEERGDQKKDIEVRQEEKDEKGKRKNRRWGGYPEEAVLSRRRVRRLPCRRR